MRWVSSPTIQTIPAVRLAFFGEVVVALAFKIHSDFSFDEVSQDGPPIGRKVSTAQDSQIFSVYRLPDCSLKYARVYLPVETVMQLKHSNAFELSF